MCIRDSVANVHAQAESIGPSVGHVSLYLGLDRSDAELGLTGTNLWIYPDRDYKAYWERLSAGATPDVLGAYISFPSAKDPCYQQRNPGRSSIEAIGII